MLNKIILDLIICDFRPQFEVFQLIFEWMNKIIVNYIKLFYYYMHYIWVAGGMYNYIIHKETDNSHQQIDF